MLPQHVEARVVESPLALRRNTLEQAGYHTLTPDIASRRSGWSFVNVFGKE
jgi:hypothetical protein